MGEGMESDTVLLGIQDTVGKGVGSKEQGRPAFLCGRVYTGSPAAGLADVICQAAERPSHSPDPTAALNPSWPSRHALNPLRRIRNLSAHNHTFIWVSQFF